MKVDGVAQQSGTEKEVATTKGTVTLKQSVKYSGGEGGGTPRNSW